MTLSREIGHQFLMSALSLLVLGRHVITHWWSDIDKHPFEKPQFNAFVIMYFNFCQKTLRNSVVIPSMPGVLFDFIFF